VILFAAALVALAVGQDVSTVTATSLTDKTVSIPLRAGAHSVYVVTFERDAQSQATEWTVELRTIVASPARLFQVAVLDGVPAFARRFVVAGIRKGIPENMQGDFLVVSEGSDLRRVVGSGGSAEAYVVVTDGKGHLMWRTHGNVSAPALRELASLLGKQN
jgi:hypothetical protein